MAHQKSTNGSATGLASLPLDILALITAHLSAQNAKNLALVNHALSHPARYRLTEAITIDAKVADFESLQRQLDSLHRENLLPAVRHVTIFDHEYDYRGKCYKKEREEGAQRLRHIALCSALRAMSGLIAIDWQGNHIPDVMIDFLADGPQVRLSAHVDKDSRYRRRAIGTLLDQLPNVRGLYALDVKFRYNKADDCIAFMRSLKGVLLACKALRKLRLDIRFALWGCVVHDPPTSYHGLGFRDSEKMPPLEELEIEDYPFGGEGGIGLSQRVPHRYPTDTQEIVDWAREFDWSQLRVLKIPEHPALFNLFMAHAGHLPALREVQCMWASQLRESSGAFPATLESMTCVLPGRHGVNEICRNGATLERLAMHYRGRLPARDAEFLGVPELEQIRSQCTALRKLIIEIQRDNGDWSYRYLDVLATYPKLESLHLIFQLPPDAHEEGGERLKKPLLTFSAASMLFRYLRRRGSNINELYVYADATSLAPPREATGPEDEDEDDMCTAPSFQCMLSERDWDLAPGRFTTTCMDVNEHANEWMRAQEGQLSAMGGGRLPSFEEFEDEMSAFGPAAQRSFRIAWLGPPPPGEDGDCDDLLN